VHAHRQPHRYCFFPSIWFPFALFLLTVVRHLS
jgi:hypothetical protein